MSSSRGSRQRAIRRAIERGQIGTRSQGTALLRPGDNAPGGLGRYLANDLEHRLLEFLHDAQVHERAGDGELEAELLANFTCQLENHVGEPRPISAFLTCLCHRPRQFVVDDPLHAFETSRGRELLLDDLTGMRESDDLGGQLPLAFETLVNGGFADAEVTGSFGLGMT